MESGVTPFFLPIHKGFQRDQFILQSHILQPLKSKYTVVKSFKLNLNITIPNIKSCYKTYFYCKNIWRCHQKPYLCSVFFIVLDLRLTKVGVRRDSFFLPIAQNLQSNTPQLQKSKFIQKMVADSNNSRR